MNVRCNDGQRIQLKLGEILNNTLNSSSSLEVSDEFYQAIENLERVADDYPAEKERDVEGGQRWGEMALVKAIDLTELASKNEERIRLIRKFIEKYPDSTYASKYRYDLGRLSETDFSNAGGVLNIDGKFYNVRLLSIDLPKKHSFAEFAVTGSVASNPIVKLNQLSSSIAGESGSVESVRLDRIDNEEAVSATVNCRTEKSSGGTYTIKSSSINLKLNEEAVKVCEKGYIRLKNVELEEIARVRLIPSVSGTRTETNLSVNIGIEKRNIKLSPDKTEELIGSLNDSIKKWESINTNLGKVVEGLKGACFATAGVLTVKNFLTGIGGEALARQKVMPSWTVKCNDLVSSGKYTSLDACYLDNSNAIDTDVDTSTKAINQINSRIENIEKNYVESSTLGGSNIDRSKAAVAYCNDLKSRYGSRIVKTKEEDKKLTDILGECESGYNQQGLYGYNELREIEYQIALQENSVSEDLMKSSDNILKGSYDQILDNRERYKQVEQAKQLKNLGLPSPIVATSNIRKNVVGEVVSLNGLSDSNLKQVVPSTTTHLSAINVYNSKGDTIDGKQRTGFDSGNYYLGMAKDSEGYYGVTDVFVKDSGCNCYKVLDSTEKAEFLDIYGIGRITPSESVSYINPYKNAEARYYEREPYKGMPAIVPFDTREGWYAATRQTLPAFGGIGAFDASGRVTSFYLCNVGPNGLEQFYEGYGDDICQLINLNTGQPLGYFPGLSESEAKRRVGQAITAIQDASNQYGRKVINVNGKDLGVGNPAANLPSTQCQNFMSPKECTLLFNVCDPVICPSSRCDFGGKYPVADVVQTGIVGSTLLCLPNFVGLGGDVAVPVCLTGIHAGIDGFVSILKNHRDCLTESLATGKTIGICDQIYSVYLCEFFWRQIAPIAKVILPKIVETAYGQGTRGGGEYLTVGAAWQSTQDSVNYFTQSYAVNSIKAFKVRSIDEAGETFCKAFVSAKAPISIKALVQPESPPQFHAWFSSTKFTDATVPATSQYKVFYHIFAGKDQGVYYSVYLKNPPESGFFAIPASVGVASGFVGKGQYATESKDFTAPEGYKELCVRVNDQEECGFNQVSTSFALNYLRDSYVSGQAGENDIKSERECVSGSANLAPLTPNLAAGAEESLIPEIYNRGIVRICSSENPGSSTDPTRFSDVGYCDDQKLRCWLDKESVKNAITDNNKGVKDATLAEIEKNQRADLAAKGIIVGDDITVAEIKSLTSNINELAKKTSISETETNELVSRLDTLLNRSILNHHKANILYLIGRTKALYVEKAISGKMTNIARNSVETIRGEIISPTPSLERYYLSNKYDETSKLNLIESFQGSQKIIFNIESGKIYVANSRVLIGNIQRISDESYVINFVSDAQTLDELRNYIESSLGSVSDDDINLYYKFKGSIIIEDDIVFAGTGQARSIR